jgi:hypothetical protein
MTDDGPDYGGTIQHVAITLETSGTPPHSDVSDTHCTITLPANQFATNHGSSLASMSFSSNGSTLAWGQDDGVYEADVSNPSNCASVTGSVHLVVPGGQMPFLGAAALTSAAPIPNQKGHAPNTTITRLRVNKRSHKAAIRFLGSGGTGRLSFKCKLDRGRWTGCRSPLTYKDLKKGKHTFQVEALDHSGHVDRTPATRMFTV